MYNITDAKSQRFQQPFYCQKRNDEVVRIGYTAHGTNNTTPSVNISIVPVSKENFTLSVEGQFIIFYLI